MIFGPTPVAEALGCILAHSVDLGTSRLRKGQVIEPSHVKALSEAGHQSVIVARLEEGDVDENTAASRLGTALLAGIDNIASTVAATGRVNLIAERAGVVEIDGTALAALNSVNPMITLATVPPMHQIHKGGMIGTVKIISYAVPEADLNAACAEAGNALRLHTPAGLTASLLVTRVHAGADETKGIASTRARLDALDAELVETVTVPHTAQDLSHAIQAAKGELVLILTGSATSDPYDVGPQALRKAGGTLTRFGMPVDPGNLLFLGQIGSRPVIGLPGCARSPALNGADIVLSRILCGLEVSSDDIAGMGVGGLLKEIPTRPRPRRA